MNAVNLPDPGDPVAVREWARTIDAVPPEDYVPVLDVLRAWFGDRYRIRRTPSLWWATDRRPNTSTAPTVLEPELERFVAKLIAPGPRVAPPRRVR